MWSQRGTLCDGCAARGFYETMKLLYLHEFPVPSRFANGVHVAQMCSAFAGHGIDVTLCVPDKGKEMSAEQLAVHYGLRHPFGIWRVPSACFGDRVYRYAWNAMRYAKSVDVDIVYGRSVVACMLAARAGLKTIYEGHQPVTGRMNRIAFSLLLSCDSLSHVVVISEALKKMYMEVYALPESKIIVAHDGADPGKIVTGSLSEQSVNRERVAVTYIGSLGHEASGRGIEIIVSLAGQFPHVQFNVYGGSTGQVQYWRKKSNISNLNFLGFIPPHRVNEKLFCSDILLAPYQRKVIVGGGGDTSAWMSPLKMFEYMASGKAILCSDLPVLREVLEHEKTALLVPPEDVGAWVSALRRLIDDVDLRVRLGEAARNELEEKYTWEKRARKVLE